MSESASLTGESLVRTLIQLKIAKAIIWLLSDRRKRYPSDSRFLCLYRAEIKRKAKVNIQNVDDYISELEKRSMVLRIFSYDKPKQWWALLVVDEGKLIEAVNEQVLD